MPNADKEGLRKVPVPVPVCPKKALHTPHPEGYLAHTEWMEHKSKTHRQIRCPACGLWAIWIPKGKQTVSEALNW